MTFEKLNELIVKYNIPSSVKLMSDSGWECDATDMDGIYYNKEQNILVFTQGIGQEDYLEPEWSLLWTDTTKGNINNYFYIDTSNGNKLRLNSTDYICSFFKEKFIKELKDNDEFENYYGIKETQEKIDFLMQNLNLCQPLYWTIQVLNNTKYESIGYIGFNIQDRDFDIEIYIFKKYRNKGYGKAVLKTLVKFAFEGRLKVYDTKKRIMNPFIPKSIKATVRKENEISQALMKSCGFRRSEDGPIGLMMIPDDNDEVEFIDTIEYIYS